MNTRISISEHKARNYLFEENQKKLIIKVLNIDVIYFPLDCKYKKYHFEGLYTE